MKPLLLVLIPLDETYLGEIGALFELRYAPDRAARTRAIAADGAAFVAVLTNGTTGLEAAEIDAMPSLGLLSALGAGHENLAVEHARQRGIAVVTGSGTNANCVADHALALLLASVRNIVPYDAACRRGVWRDELPLCGDVCGKRMGIVGMGTIGEKIARRGLGFEMEIGYHNRRPRQDSAYRYFDSVTALAQWCDYLMVTTPGGAHTRHLIDAGVLAALGPRGFVVNVARGSVLDTAALAQALREGRIAGAGIDVYESEPQPPQALIALENVVLSPHLAGRSPEAMGASVRMFIENARRHFAGEPLLTPL